MNPGTSQQPHPYVVATYIVAMKKHPSGKAYKINRQKREPLALYQVRSVAVQQMCGQSFAEAIYTEMDPIPPPPALDSTRPFFSLAPTKGGAGAKNNFNKEIRQLRSRPPPTTLFDVNTRTDESNAAVAGTTGIPASRAPRHQPVSPPNNHELTAAVLPLLFPCITEKYRLEEAGYRCCCC